jgi:hypothetical protein
MTKKQRSVNFYVKFGCLLVLLGFAMYFVVGAKQTTEHYNSSPNKTELIVKNSSKEDSVKVYFTLQSPNSVVGCFGIKPHDTTGSKSQGFFYAKKDSTYYCKPSSALFGYNISFKSPPIPCQTAIDKGFKTGVNIFEGSINCEFEVFDISCVDGVNCVIRATVSDTVNWSTGMGSEKEKYISSQNRMDLAANCNIRGVFPYRCSNCDDTSKTNVPQNCFDLPLNCSRNKTCQVARTGKAGGSILVEYLGAISVLK